MLILYRKQPSVSSNNGTQSSPEPAPKKKETRQVKAHTLGKNECRMGSDHKITCPSCESRLGVPDDSVPPFRFTCPKCDTKIKVVETEKF